MKHFFSLLIAIVFFAGCSKNDDPEPITANQTILIYMAGENSLSGYTYENLESIIEGAKNSKIERCNLLVFTDANRTVPKLYKIEKNKAGVTDSVLVKTYEELNSVDKTVMNSIITDVFSKYPAEEKGLFLWSHASAWLPSDINNHLRSFGQDGRNHMEITELEEALPTGIDYIVFDACYMASIEVAFQLKDKTKYIIGSSAEILAEGFPYVLTIPELLADKELEKRLSDCSESFYNHYNSQAGSDANRTGNISLIKTAGLTELAMQCRSILAGHYSEEKMIDPSTSALNLQALEYLTSPYYYSFLYDFEDYISALTEQKVDLSSIVLYKNTTPTAYFDAIRTIRPIDRYCGLSIYVPQVRHPKMNDWYRQLDWYKAVYE